MGRIAVFLSSGLGLGFLPKAPGTFGTLWGVLLFYLGRHLSWQIFAAATVVAILLAILISHFAEKSLGTHDSSHIVVDEIVGYLVTVVGFSFDWKVAIWAFFVFRFFDIAKPFPVRWMDQKIPGGAGVVLDDVGAGIYANLTLRLGFFLWYYFN